MKSEVKFQKFFVFANLIPTFYGHYLIKLTVIRYSPKYWHTFLHGMPDSYNLIL